MNRYIYIKYHTLNELYKINQELHRRSIIRSIEQCGYKIDANSEFRLLHRCGNEEWYKDTKTGDTYKKQGTYVEKIIYSKAGGGGV